MIIDNTGAYTTPRPSFQTSKGTFTLVSTESAPDEDDYASRKQNWQQRNLGSTLDTYAHKQSGEHFTWTRKQIWKWDRDGSITAL
jgi:hypothetical protein